MSIAYEIDQGGIEIGKWWAGKSGTVEQRMNIIRNLFDCCIDRCLILKVYLNELRLWNRYSSCSQRVDFGTQIDDNLCGGFSYTGGSSREKWIPAGSNITFFLTFNIATYATPNILHSCRAFIYLSLAIRKTPHPSLGIGSKGRFQSTTTMQTLNLNCRLN